MPAWRLHVFLAVWITIGSGCASAPTAEQLANADYGTPMMQADAEAVAEEWLRYQLFDAESARFEWDGVERGWIREAPIHGGQLRFGYQLTGRINAKNRMGGYVGFKPYLFLFFDGEIGSVYSGKELRGRFTTMPYMGKVY